MEQAAPAGAPHTQTVCLVDEQYRPMPPAHLVQPTQRGKRAVGAEDRIGDHQCAFLVPAGQGGGYRVDVTVRSHHDAGARESAGVHQRGVRRRVGDHQRTGPGEARHRAEVGGVARGEHQGRCGADEGCQFRLELAVQFGVSGDQPGAGGSRTPGPQRRNCALDNLGVAGQTQVVVGGQIDLAGHRWSGAQLAAQSGPPALLPDGVEPGQRRGVGAGGQSHRLLP